VLRYSISFKYFQMKTKPFIFLHLISFMLVVSTLINAQQVTSVVIPKKEKTSADILESSLFRVIYTFSQKATKDREPIILTDTMALTVGQIHSVYYDWNKQRNDSINSLNTIIPVEKITHVNVFKDEYLLQSRLELHQEPTLITDYSKGESARIFKNRAKNEIITMDKGPSEGGTVNPASTYLQVTEIIPPQNWTISEDTLTVLGYACQKATATFRGRNYSAWFTLDIPVSEGPWKLHGLPGIILKAEDDESIFHFHAIGITQTGDEKIEIPTDRKITSTTLKQLHDYRKNRFKEVMYSFFEGGKLSIFRVRNPIMFNELEIE
jgi:GLPGLI family protein